MKSNRFTSLKQAQGMSKRIWICKNADCRTWHHLKKPEVCRCEGKDLWYFPSKRQAERWVHLLMQESYGLITNLCYEVPYRFEENGILIFTYKADATFTDVKTGEEIVEDVKASKNPKSLDPVFKMKKKLIEARFGIEIKIVTGR